jgi:hypothetical protein
MANLETTNSTQANFEGRLGQGADEEGNPLRGRNVESIASMVNSGANVNFQYPESLGRDPLESNYVLFEIYETDGEALANRRTSQPAPPSNLSSQANTTNQLAQAGGEGAVSIAVNAIANEIRGIFASGRSQPGAPGEFSRNQSRLGFGTKIKSSGVSIALPVPANISSSYKMAYDETDFTGIGQMITAGQGLDALLDGKTNSAEAQEAIKQLVVGLPMNVIDSLAKIVGIDNLNLKAAGLASRQQAMNKFAEKLFTGMGRRQFSFEWELSPRSLKDAITIQNIIYAFKKYSHPTISDGGLYLNYPAQFKIGFYNKENLNNYLFKIAMCGCESVEVSYGGDDLTFFRSAPNGEGASPVSIKLKVDFTELELLTRERIEQGF